MRTFCLSMHAAYRCRDSGACCTAGWPVPLEDAQVPAIAAAMRRGRLAARQPWLIAAAGAPPGMAGVLAHTPQDACVFHSTADRRESRCEIHRALGHGALPASCRHFPREYLIDSRGVSVTLSLYCPTAVDMLLEWPGPVEIVAGPALTGDRRPEGLDARGVLPPLLSARVLMDYEGLSAWEGHVVRVLAPGDGCRLLTPEEALDRIAVDSRRLSLWRPGSVTLADAVRALNRPAAAPRPEIDWSSTQRLFDAARAALPADRVWAAAPADAAQIWDASVAEGWHAHRAAIGRFLCAHAFASWMPYQGGGLAAHVAALRQALAVLRVEAIRGVRQRGSAMAAGDLREAMRRADLLLRHLAERSLLARLAARAWMLHR